MRMGVMSDTHGNIEYMNHAARRMEKEFSVDRIIHLGDDMEDTRSLRGITVPLTVVPGVFEETYTDPKIPHRFIEEIEGVRFLISHTPTRDSHDLQGDLDPQKAMDAGEADILLHGHTHVYRIEEMGKGYAVNPGHLKYEDKRGKTASFAVIDVTRNSGVKVSIIEIDGGLLDEKMINL